MPGARLAEIVASLSLSTEAAAGVPPETASRAAILCVHVAREIGLGLDAQRALYYAALLRYIGCSGFAHETAAYGAGDDIDLLRVLNPGDTGSMSNMVGRIVRGAGHGRGTAARVRSVTRLLADPALGHKLGSAHCEQAVALASHLNLGREVAEALGQMYERWDGKGAPLGIAGEKIGILARVMRGVFAFELHRGFEGPTAAVDMTRARRGGEIDPTIADVLLVRADEWVALVDAPSVWPLVLDLEPSPFKVVAETSLTNVATAFARFADLKSPFTLGHSTEVARLTDRALEKGGASTDDRSVAFMAALLHDLGCTSVSNDIWDKPGKLGPLESERAREHVVQTERVLQRSTLLQRFASIAAAHHERLDGTGYPRGTSGGGVGRAARVLAAADVRRALAEDRAYRPAFSPDRATHILANEVKGGRLDREAVELVLWAAGEPVPRLRGEPPAGLSEREVEVLRLLARGLSNKEVAQKLAISPRTVGHHVAHIYDKTGVRTRASAALFAVENDLIAP